MQKNIGHHERVIRVLVGLIFIAISPFTDRIIFSLLGLLLVMTGGFGYCGIYRLFNFSTAKPGIDQGAKSDQK